MLQKVNFKFIYSCVFLYINIFYIILARKSYINLSFVEFR